MCGIAGIVSVNSTLISQQRLKKMTDTLVHRGPDGEGFWINETGSAGLGHRRLSVIDLTTAAAQPMSYLNRYWIVHNGEIYNYKELKILLLKKGYHFQTESDTEVIPAAYDLWKEDCISHFDGMFAFAIWDGKENELFIARDRFGEKPLFYHYDQKQFIFASEMKALWAAGIERKANLKMLFNFITIGYVDNPGQPDETFYESIQKLPAACFLKFKPTTSEPVIEKYWDIDVQVQNKKISDGDAVEKFTDLFTSSVNRRLRSDVPVGSSLSGGLDSSSVAAFIHRENVQSGNYKCFTAVFPDFNKNEFYYSNKITEQYNFQHLTIPVTGEEMINELENLSYYQEEPFGSAGIYAQYKVFELAKQNDIKVLLDGQGADEILAGYHKYYKWFWQELFYKRKLLRSRELKAAKRNDVQDRFGIKNIFASLFPELATVVLERQYLLHALTQEDLTKEFIRLQSKEAYYSTPAISNLSGVLYFNTCTHGLEELLRYADRNSMALGREVRLPFLSHELVEFIFSLPSSFKIRNGCTKWLLRKAMEKELPPEITWRKEKIGFEPPQKAWMENPKVQEVIHAAKKKLVGEKILKPEVLNKKIQPSEATAPDNFDWRYLTASTCLFNF